MAKLSTENYKGVRDFYPEEMFVQNYIFGIWRKTVEQFGYLEYNASLLEPAELYKAKTGEEIVNEQTYTFKDRGNREVTLRPEMTPTVARMVAGKINDLSFPLRWYSIPNLFRYERPQKGRLREHWQLNVDIFGVKEEEAETEIITIIHEMMKNFGAKISDYVIRLNSRKIINDLCEHFKLNEEESHKVAKILDKKNKIPSETFKEALEEIVGDKAIQFIESLSSNEKLLETIGEKNADVKRLLNLIEKLGASGISNLVFDPTLMRGFDYYTDTVFEVFDTNTDNPRSLFGGGRYDDLLDIFDARKVPAVGFGVGDVTTRDFLEAHGLLPKYKPSATLHICPIEEKYIEMAKKLALKLRAENINVSVDLSGKKIGDQLKMASKQAIPFVLVLGEDEIKSETYPIKNMATGEEKKVKAEEIAKVII